MLALLPLVPLLEAYDDAEGHMRTGNAEGHLSIGGLPRY